MPTYAICHLLALGTWQKEGIEQTKKVRLATKKSSVRDQRISCIFLGCLNGKNSNSYCSSEEKNRSDKKSSLSRQKKYSQRLEDFAHIFGKLTIPYVMFEQKKNLKFLLLLRRKGQIAQKKLPQQPKKVQLETRGFHAFFLLLTTCALCNV